MISKDLYEILKSKEVNALTYIPYSSVKEAVKVKQTSGLIESFNDDLALKEVYYGYDKFDEIYEDLPKVKQSHLISFIPSDQVETMKTYGYEVYGHYKEYRMKNIPLSDTPLQVVSDNELHALVDISYKCQFQTRGFLGHDENWFQEWIENGDHQIPVNGVSDLLVIKEEETIAGYACIAVYNGVLWIREIAIDPEFQCKGYGRKLLEMAFLYGHEHDANKSYLMADTLNAPGHKLYTSLGYQETSDEQIDMIKICVQKDLNHYLGKSLFVKIDRPMHSVHPKHKDMVYPINYGYIPFTIAPDHDEIDAYVIGPNKPVAYFKGQVIAIIKREDDNEEKLIVADQAYSDEEIMSKIHFTEQYFKSSIIRKST